MGGVRTWLLRPVALVAVGALGAVVRLVFSIANADPIWSADAGVYRALARNLADGKGYVIPGAGGDLVETATHPPAFPFLLAGLERVGLTSELQQRVVLSFVAAVGVVLVGFVARRVAGAVAGVVAALIAAVHPLWFQHAGIGVSETLYLVVVPLLLLLAVGVIDRPTWLRMAAVGATVGLVTLTRSEGVLFLVVLVLPVAVVAFSGWRDRLAAVLVALAAVLVVITPWLVRNHREFGGLALSTNQGVTLAGSWCDRALEHDLGGWDEQCAFGGYALVQSSTPPGGDDEWNELTIDRELTSRSIDYAFDHVGDVPRLVAARVGRAFGVYQLERQADFDSAEGRDPNLQRAGQYVHLVLLALAVFGATRVARRYLVVLLAGPVVALLVAAEFYGATRMRVAAEPAVVILAAVGGVALWQLATRDRDAPSSATGPHDAYDQDRALLGAGSGGAQERD